MAGLIIGKRGGRWFFTARGCCDTTATQAMYDRHHALQVLAEGGTLTGWDAQGFELRDRRGRAHRYPRGWSGMLESAPPRARSSSNSSAAT